MLLQYALLGTSLKYHGYIGILSEGRGLVYTANLI